VTGHSYASSGAFSTRTVIVDLRSGKPVADLERFKVIRDGKEIEAPDFNFWGVTFARDPNRFYATLATDGHHYLVEGDLAARTVSVLQDGVECPSLSPDGTRIAFKARTEQDRWRLQVLDLATGRRTLLSETRSVDDQAEWLDGGWVAYGLGGDVWAVRSDGAGRPRRLVAHASSPTAQRQ
jgi:Tol biopolymer transport system component